jgi:hypothetical protein
MTYIKIYLESIENNKKGVILWDAAAADITRTEAEAAATGAEDSTCFIYSL